MQTFYLLKYSLFLLVFLLTNTAINSQNKAKLNNLSFEGTFTYGRIFIHTARISTPITTNTLGGEFSIEKQLDGQRNEQQIFAKYPQMGLLINYQNFNQSYIGWGIGIAPYVNMDFINYKRFRLYGRLALGVGWLSQHYNLATNTQNNIVGSHWSNNTILRITTAFRINKYVELRPSFHFSHFSNGASQLPNYGINVTSLQLGVAYCPNGYSKNKFKKIADTPTTLNKRIYLNTTVQLGIRESTTYGGAKYPAYLIGMDINKWVTKLHRARIGIEYERLNHIKEFLLNTQTYTNRQAAWQASRISAYGGVEIVWGKFTLGTNIGFYLTRNELQPYFFHIRILARYYFTNPVSSKVQPYIGWGLKTHKIVAEYMALNVGVLF